MKKLKFVISLLLFLPSVSHLAAQQCTGDACSVISTRANPYRNVAWQFTNKSNRPVSIGIRLYAGTCLDPSYITLKPNSFQYWGQGSQGFCSYTANYAGPPVSIQGKTNPHPNQAVFLKNNYGSKPYIIPSIQGIQNQAIDFCLQQHFDDEMLCGKFHPYNAPLRQILFTSL